MKKTKRNSENLVMVTKNKLVPFEKSNLHIFNRRPFKSKRMNYYYYRVCFLLEEGTNKIVFKDGNNNSIPAVTKSLASYVLSNTKSGYEVIRKFRYSGILLKVIVYGKEALYLNPTFAFCGDKIPAFLLTLFEYDGDRLYGSHIFNIKHSKYERTENFEETKLKN